MSHRSKLTYPEQINHLKKKGITFIGINEAEAITYLKENNNFFKLLAYRKNFDKDITGSKYLNLDFAYLVDLAILDMYLREIIVQMALNIEHFAKVKLMKHITDNPNEDGYTIVSDYINNLPENNRIHLMQELNKNSRSPYCREAYLKYKDDLPVWVFLEIITFGSFISFYKNSIERPSFQFTRQESNRYKDNFYLMLTVKYIRNAAAHNNCILNDLKTKSREVRKKANWGMTRAMSNADISTVIIDRKLANERVQQIITCLWAHKQIVNSKGINDRTARQLHQWVERVQRDYDYSFNSILTTTLNLLSNLIDKWFPIV